MKKSLDTIKIPVGNYNADLYKRMFCGWSRYSDAPKETKKLFEKIGQCFRTVEGPVFDRICYETPEANRRIKIGCCGVLFNEKDGFLYIYIHPWMAFSSSNGAERLHGFITFAGEEYKRLYRPVLMEFGLI